MGTAPEMLRRGFPDEAEGVEAEAGLGEDVGEVGTEVPEGLDLAVGNVVVALGEVLEALDLGGEGVLGESLGFVTLFVGRDLRERLGVLEHGGEDLEAEGILGDELARVALVELDARELGVVGEVVAAGGRRGRGKLVGGRNWSAWSRVGARHSRTNWHSSRRVLLPGGFPDAEGGVALLAGEQHAEGVAEHRVVGGEEDEVLAAERGARGRRWRRVPSSGRSAKATARRWPGLRM